VTSYNNLTGAGILNEGANSITFYDVNLYGNKDGLRNVGAIIAAVPSAPNINRYFGGNIQDNTRWGIFEDVSGAGGGVGPNIGSAYFGLVLSGNGTGAGAAGGNVFLQGSENAKLIGNYFEYGERAPNQHILIGDAVNHVKSSTILGNSFVGGAAVSIIANANATGTYIEGNDNFGGATNFVWNGANSRLLKLGANFSLSTNYFGGFDTAADSDVECGAPVVINQHCHTTSGMGFATITGYGAAANALNIITPPGGSSVVRFLDSSGTDIGGVSNSKYLEIDEIRGKAADLIIRDRPAGTNIVTLQARDGTVRATMSDAGLLNLTSGKISLAGLTIMKGIGSPVGVVSCSNGDLYLRADGGVGSTQYVCEAPNTWNPK
jgi:hypothetical protein